MINYETILSSYDDKLTLMQWLKKVEDALNNASAVAFKVNKRGDATITFSVEFEDGSELETGPIVLEQGESVESAAIVNGHLQLTLTNGDVLDAGDLGGVSSFSIDGSQHLIVHYQNGTTQDLGAIFAGNITISGNLNVSGDISGNIPTLTTSGSEISAQKPVVEVMAGYSAALGTHPNFTIENVYCGAVKNGNKLTFVVAVKITRTANTTGNLTIADFYIPNAIGTKLFPVPIGGYNYGLAYSPISAMSSIKTGVTQNLYIEKQSNTQVRFQLLDAATLNNLTEGMPYYVRVEATFLLSENLAA